MFAKKFQANHRVNRMKITPIAFGMNWSSFTDHALAARPSFGWRLPAKHHNAA